MKVLKFGGSSVASASAMSRVIQIVTSAAKQEKLILVSSAISKCTDSLISIGDKAASSDPGWKEVVSNLRQRHHDIIDELLRYNNDRREAKSECDATLDALTAYAGKIYEAGSITPEQKEEIQTFGELLSTRILAAKLSEDGIRTVWGDSRKIVRTESGYVRFDVTDTNVRNLLLSHPEASVFVLPGFIASEMNGRVTTLGRGGSDYSAAIFAAASDARILEIWTDVPGIMTTDPRKIPAASTIPYLSYRAARDMAEFGAKVLYPPTIRPAMTRGIPICILNTFDPTAQGSIIIDNPPHRDSDLLGLTSLPYKDMLSSAPNMDIPPIEASEDDTVICLVGNKIRNAAATLSRLHKALRTAGINAHGIASTEFNIFASVSTEKLRDALSCVHREFFETRPEFVINAFVAGYGAVGKALVELIDKGGDRTAMLSGKRIRIVGISDSNHYIIDERGIDLSRVPDLLAQGESSESGAFFDALVNMALRSSVLVDCTDNDDIGLRYDEFFRRGMNIVSCNRGAFAVPFSRYSAMKNTAHDYGLKFKFATTVGASLPVLEYISRNALSGDEITSIEAVVSCTMNNIITGYDGANTESLAVLLKKAQDIGLTEADPRNDLKGKDAMRKLLILAREAGVPLEEEDIEITPMLGPEFFEGDIDTFYKRLAEYEPHFIQREKELDDMNMRQRFVASLTKDPEARLGYKAEIKMQLVSEDSPFFWISGTENVIVVKSQFSAPTVIKGAGEGAKMAAASVISDILKI